MAKARYIAEWCVVIIVVVVDIAEPVTESVTESVTEPGAGAVTISGTDAGLGQGRGEQGRSEQPEREGRGCGRLSGV